MGKEIEIECVSYTGPFFTIKYVYITFFL